MEFLVDQFKFLGLNDKEVRVFTALVTFGRMNMTKISSRANLSRTTVDAIIRRLVAQGLVMQERVGGHQEYSVRLEEVAEKLDQIEQRFREKPAKHEHEQKGEGDVGCAVCLQHVYDTQRASGHTAIHDMTTKVFMEHAGERVLMLLSTLSVTEERMHRFAHCVTFARDAEVKLEVLTTTDVAKGVSLHAKELTALLSAYDLTLHFLPLSFCFEHIDVIAFRDVVLLINQHTNIAERLTSVHTVLAFNHLLRVARGVGWSIDMKTWLEGVCVDNK